MRDLWPQKEILSASNRALGLQQAPQLILCDGVVGEPNVPKPWHNPNMAATFRILSPFQRLQGSSSFTAPALFLLSFSKCFHRICVAKAPCPWIIVADRRSWTLETSIWPVVDPMSVGVLNKVVGAARVIRGVWIFWRAGVRRWFWISSWLRWHCHCHIRIVGFSAKTDRQPHVYILAYMYFNFFITCSLAMCCFVCFIVLFYVYSLSLFWFPLSLRNFLIFCLVFELPQFT